MDILLRDKNCIFTKNGLLTQEYAELIPYDNILRIIQDSRYQYYEMTFYDKRKKKRKVDISYEEQNEMEIFAIFRQKIYDLSERQGHMPFLKAGAVWLILYIVFALTLLAKFLTGVQNIQNIEVPWILYPLLLLVNCIPVQNLSLQEMFTFLFIAGVITILLMFCSYIRSEVTIYEKR